MRAIDADAMIDRLKEWDTKDKTDKALYNFTLNRINEQPTIQPEQTNCDYCHEDSDGYVMPLEKNCHAFIRYGMNGWELSLKAKGWHGSAKIKYCPICGRSLTHE